MAAVAENTSQIVASIAERGFVELNDLFDREQLRRIQEIIERPFGTPTINGQTGYVQFGNIRFLSFTMSWGRDIIDLYANPRLIEIADEYSQSPVHLSNHRIYRTFPSQTDRMHWHVDNKSDVYDEETGTFKTEVIKDDRGLILIMYLCDVQDGGLQIVEGSHLWSFEQERESWDADEANWADRVVTFNNRPTGTAILYDYRCIHRAKPYTGGQIRTSLFGQFSPTWMPVGEPILLNTRDIRDLSPLQERVLNVGQAPSTANWPIGRPEEVLAAAGVDLTPPPAPEPSVRASVKSAIRRILK